MTYRTIIKGCACTAVAMLALASVPTTSTAAQDGPRAGTAATPGNLRESDPSPAGSASTTAAAPGGADGGAGGYGKVGDPYSQAGYGAGAFGNGRPSPR